MARPSSVGCFIAVAFMGIRIEYADLTIDITDRELPAIGRERQRCWGATQVVGRQMALGSAQLAEKPPLKSGAMAGMFFIVEVQLYQSLRLVEVAVLPCLPCLVHVRDVQRVFGLRSLHVGVLQRADRLPLRRLCVMSRRAFSLQTQFSCVASHDRLIGVPTRHERG